MEIIFAERKPIWEALSKFYLDTELEEHDFRWIASIIKESPYSFEEVKQIDKQEVFPMLFWNSISVAGIWSGFEEEWLFNEITKELDKKTWFSEFKLRIKYQLFKGMYADHWKNLEEAFQKF